MNKKPDIASKKICLMLLSSVFVDRGVERIILWLHQYLPRDIYDVQIVALRNNVPFAERLKQKGQDIFHVIGMRSPLDFGALIKFCKFVRKFKPDVVHIHHFRTAVLCRPILKMCRVPVILYSVHNQWGGRLHYSLDRWTTRYGDATIPFSLAVKKFLLEEEKLSPEKITDPVYIGINIEKFKIEDKAENNKVRKDLGLDPSDNMIGFVGALSEQKGLTYLIDAVDDLHHDFPNLRCLLIGEGEQEKYLKAKVHNLGLQEHVLFLGQRYDIPELLHVMDVFVLPSLWEGLPQVVLEAMAARCPVLATAVDGTPEIITDGVNGLLVPSKDSQAIAGGIRLLLENNELRTKLAESGYKTVCDRFSVKRMVSDFDNLYKQYLYAKQ